MQYECECCKKECNKTFEVCEDCVDKAASFDITKKMAKELFDAIEKALSMEHIDTIKVILHKAYKNWQDIGEKFIKPEGDKK